MKKFITIIITAIIISVGTSFVVNGQVKITQKSDRLVEVTSLDSFNINKLMRKGESYLYVITKTSNQFDDAMVLLLGSNKEEILLSLNTIYETFDTLGDEETITIDNGFGIEYTINKWIITEEIIKLAKRTKVPLDPCFKVNSDHHAGYGTIWKSAVKNAIDYFQN